MVMLHFWDMTHSKSLKVFILLGTLYYATVHEINYATFFNLDNKIQFSHQYDAAEFSLFCPFNKPLKPKAICYLNWVSRGHIMISRSASQLREKEIYNSFREIDRLLGKKQRATSIQFTLYGEFDRRTNVIFKYSSEY